MVHRITMASPNFDTTARDQTMQDTIPWWTTCANVLWGAARAVNSYKLFANPHSKALHSGRRVGSVGLLWGPDVDGSIAMNKMGSLTWTRRASLATAALAGIVLIASSVWIAMLGVHQPAPTPPPTRAEVTAAAMRAGLHADSLLAAGVSSASFASIVSSVYEYLTAHAGQMRTLDAQVDSARRAASGPRSDAPPPLTTMTLDQAVAARDAFYAAVFDAATTSMTQEQKSMLRSQKQNKGKSVPAKYTVVDRSDAEWVALREALADQRIAARDGREANAEVRQRIATADANSVVAAAGQRLSGDRAAARAAWTQAIAAATR